MQDFITYLKALRSESLKIFTEEEVKAIEQWEKDDAGVDLISFIPDTQIPEAVVFNLQTLLCGIWEFERLKKRERVLEGIESTIKFLKSSLE